MENLITFPTPFPLFPPPIGGVGKVGKKKHSRKVPNRENRENREHSAHNRCEMSLINQSEKTL
jgi:hypothetical protein